MIGFPPQPSWNASDDFFREEAGYRREAPMSMVGLGVLDDV